MMAGAWEDTDLSWFFNKTNLFLSLAYNTICVFVLNLICKVVFMLNENWRLVFQQIFSNGKNNIVIIIIFQSKDCDSFWKMQTLKW